MTKKLFSILLLLTAVVFSGCRSFLTVSVSKKAEGGIYCIHDKSATQITNFPTMNYLISEGRYFYATSGRQLNSKSKDGAVTVLGKVHFPHCTLGVLQSVSVQGRTPCHLTLSPDGNFLYTANYSSGDVSEFKLENGEILSFSRLIKHSGKGITSRQRSPHPHFVGFSPDGKQLFVSDLGTDEIWIYNYDSRKGLILPCAEKLKLPPGSGPRHIVFSPDGKTLFTANELNSTAGSFVKINGKWQFCKNISTLKAGTKVKNSPGAVKITSDGRFFFISNRGHNSIAFFENLGNGNFHLLDAVPSPGNFPSDILLLDNETRLAVSHLKSGTVHFFRLDKTNKKLIAEPASIKVPQAIGLCR